MSTALEATLAAIVGGGLGWALGRWHTRKTRQKLEGLEKRLEIWRRTQR